MGEVSKDPSTDLAIVIAGEAAAGVVGAAVELAVAASAEDEAATALWAASGVYGVGLALFCGFDVLKMLAFNFAVFGVEANGIYAAADFVDLIH